MRGCKCSISLIVLVSLLSLQAFPQQFNFRDSLAESNPGNISMKPQLHYSVSSTFTAIPHFGTVMGFTISPFLSVPLSTKLSVNGGIIAGRYYSAFQNINTESIINESFTGLSVYGSAIYFFNPRLTVYGSGIKQLTGTSPFNLLPKSSYTIGSSFNFGSFSIGAALQVTKRNNIFSPFPTNVSHEFYSPFDW
jgi:hypothetical protein